MSRMSRAARAVAQDEAGEAPRFEGRPLPRPDEEVFDQGLAFDIGTLLNRRQALRMFGIGAGLVGLAACGDTSSSSSNGTATSTSTATGGSTPSVSPTTATTEIPDETAGPYPGDGSNGPDVLSESGVVRSDIRSSFGTSTTTAEGVPMTLQLTIQNLPENSAGFAGVAVYVWHCDRDGNYSMYSQGVQNENYLRGVQIADHNGTVTFTSIIPACYSGRWPHIHFEVYPDEASITDSSNAIATSQIALPQDVCETVYATTGYERSVSNLAQLSLATDNVFSDDEAEHQLALVSGDVDSGYLVSLSAAVDTSTEPTGGSAPGGGRVPGGPPTN